MLQVVKQFVSFPPFWTEFGEMESPSSSGCRDVVPGCRALRSPCQTPFPAPAPGTLLHVTHQQ